MATINANNEQAALIIKHTVERGHETFYEDWTRRILEAVSSSPGYIGREVLKPASGAEPYTVIVRFVSEGDLETWLSSAERKRFIDELEGILGKGDNYEIHAGNDLWFTPEGLTRPKSWKQFLITLAAIYPLTLIVPRLLSPIFEGITVVENPLFANLVIAIVIVGLMTYVIMPFATRLLHNWLFKD